MVVNSALNMVKRTGIAKGIEVVISGKVRGQRAKAQKYKWGYLISTGQPKEEFIDEAPYRPKYGQRRTSSTSSRCATRPATAMRSS